MKAAEFDYVRATSIDEVCDLLDDAGEQLRIVLAAGPACMVRRLLPFTAALVLALQPLAHGFDEPVHRQVR